VALLNNVHILYSSAVKEKWDGLFSHPKE